MNLCSDGHDEVCYEGRRCPVCFMREDKDADISKLNDKISALENTIGERDATVDDLTVEISQLKAK